MLLVWLYGGLEVTTLRNEKMIDESLKTYIRGREKDMLLDPNDEDEEYLRMLAWLWLLAIGMIMLGGILFAIVQHYWRG